jgi:hypothetical protein
LKSNGRFGSKADVQRVVRSRLLSVGKQTPPHWAPDTIRDYDHILGVVLEFVDAVIPGEHFSVAGMSAGEWLDRVQAYIAHPVAGHPRQGIPPAAILPEY